MDCEIKATDASSSPSRTTSDGALNLSASLILVDLEIDGCSITDSGKVPGPVPTLFTLSE
jgi:hypothetical protein